MISVARILCPVDLSDGSRRAVEYAAAMGKWYESTVTAVHIFADVPVADAVPEYFAAGQVISLRDIDADALRQQLQCFVAKAAGGVQISTELGESFDVCDEILNRSADADLVVMGTHGRRGFDRLLLGSVAERVLRKAACPVMVVPPHARPAAMERIPFKEILCPVDFSESAAHALLFALHLAQESDARITLLHVIEMPPELRELSTWNGKDVIDVPAVRAAAEADALQRLRALVPPSAGTFCTIATRVEEGKGYREILRVAAELSPDVIVMGVQGRGALDLMLFGSTTHGVVLGAGCPVLTVRA